MTKNRPLIYIIDDDISVRRALILLLKAHDFRVEEFARAADFLSFMHPKGPACLVLDLQLPQMNGLALQEKMATQGLLIPIIFISGHGDIPKSVKAMKGGAVDFLPKPFTPKDLLGAIDRAVQKDKRINKEQAEISRLKRRAATLSPRELEVFRFVARGMLNKQIARKRGISLQTVKVHRGRVMQKMRAKTVTELISFAQKSGIVPAK